jgi:hypothetical protein
MVLASRDRDHCALAQACHWPGPYERCFTAVDYMIRVA